MAVSRYPNLRTFLDRSKGNIDSRAADDFVSELNRELRLIRDDINARITATGIQVAGTTVVIAQQAAVADASGGATVDTEARTALNALLARLRAHGLIAT